MKRFLLFLLTTITLLSCSNDGDELAASTDSFAPEESVIANWAIKDIEVPESFVFGKKYNIKFRYILPNNCYYYNGLDYIATKNTVKLALEVYVDLASNCSENTRQEEKSFNITINEREAYTFKIWKGKNNSGDDIFDEKIVPVTNIEN